MVSFGFDPNQPGARRLARWASELRDSTTVELRVLFVDAGQAYGPGEQVTLPRPLADELVAAGEAERVEQD